MKKLHTIRDIEKFMFEGNYCCLMPDKWLEMWKLIGSPEIKPPLVLGAWHFSSKDEKYQRFFEHIVYANKTHQLVKTLHFLNNLKIKDWSNY